MYDGEVEGKLSWEQRWQTGVENGEEGGTRGAGGPICLTYNMHLYENLKKKTSFFKKNLKVDWKTVNPDVSLETGVGQWGEGN